jgi:5-(hydroxymethyl)furfural/furfural oxidase
MGPAVVDVAEARPADVVHAAGTCRMGSPDDTDAVTDAYGRVIGYEGLRVTDASLFPRLPKAHPYLACLLLAERLAAVIKAGG